MRMGWRRGGYSSGRVRRTQMKPPPASATRQAEVIAVHHHDIERRAEHYNEGYADAERQMTEPLPGYDQPDATNPAHLRFTADVLEAAKDLDTSRAARTGHSATIFWTADELRKVADEVDASTEYSEVKDSGWVLTNADAPGLDVDRRNAIDDRLAGATPEPWVHSDEIDSHHNVTRNGWDIASCAGGDLDPAVGDRKAQAARDADFIAHAPADMHVLLAEVDRMASDLSDIYCTFTGGILSYPTYDVRVVITAIDDHIDGLIHERVQEESASLTATIERIKALHTPTCGHDDCPLGIECEFQECTCHGPWPCPTAMCLIATAGEPQ